MVRSPSSVCCSLPITLSQAPDCCRRNTVRQLIEWEEARFDHFCAIDLRHSSERRFKKVNSVAFAFRGSEMRRYRRELLNRTAQFLEYLPACSRYWPFPWSDTPSRKHEQVTCSIVVADQKDLPRRVEQYDFHAARMWPKQLPEASLCAISNLHQRGHTITLPQNAGEFHIVSVVDEIASAFHPLRTLRPIWNAASPFTCGPE